MNTNHSSLQRIKKPKLISATSSNLLPITSFGIILMCLGLFGCEYFQQKASPQERPLARVHDQYIYPSDVKGMVDEDVSGEDSIEMVNEYIRNWVRDQLIVRLARKNLPPEKLDFERQVNDYRHSLTQYTYEQALIKEKLDTTIHEDSLRAYYDRNESSYKLQQHVARLLYVKVPRQASHTDSIHYWIRQADDTTLQKIQNYCYQHGGTFHLEPDQWIYFDNFYAKLPSSINIPAQQIIEADDPTFITTEGNLYIFHVIDHRMKGEQVPFSFVREDIRKIIYNRRKSRFLENMYKNIYQEALKKGNIKTYLQ